MNRIGPALATQATQDFGHLLRRWRNSRNLSQLALSLVARVSARHLSYLETGRANPSREMVLNLAQALEMPLRDQNALLEAAGFVAMYKETPLSAQRMQSVRDAINLLLRGTEPHPTLVVNRRYDVIDCNETAAWLLEAFTTDLRSFQKPFNVALLLASPHGMRKYVDNWAEVARKVIGRVRRELGGAHTRAPQDDALLNGIAAAWDAARATDPSSDGAPLFAPVRLRRGGLRICLFTTITTLGTPLDVTLQELRVEMLFPADSDTERALEARVGEPSPVQMLVEKSDDRRT